MSQQTKRNPALQLFDQDKMDDMEHFYVLVTGIKKTTTTDTIHNCFDNTKRFGVGNVYIVIRLNEGECEIFFKRNGDYKSIKGNTYYIDDTAVTVVEEGPAFDDRVFVHNLNKLTTKDGLKCFIKAQTGHIIAYITFNIPGDTALVEFGKQIDFTMVENACKEETLDNNQLEIVPVKSSSTILVSGSKEMSGDDLFFYFDNTRQSGGTDVTIVARVDDTTHSVQFSSPKCVIDVCKRKHFLKEQPLTVQLQSTFNSTSNTCGISSTNENERTIVGQQKKCRSIPVLLQDSINVETSLNTDTNNNSKAYTDSVSTSEVHMVSDNNHKTEQSARLTQDIEKNIELNETEKKLRQDGNENENADAFAHYTVIAIRSYKAQCSNELSFQEEDKFDVVGSESERWLIGDKNGLKGLFPSEYVKKCNFGVTNTILTEGKKHNTKTSWHVIQSISVIQHIQIPKGFTKREIRDCTVMPNGDCIVLDCSNSEMIRINQYDVISVSKELSRPMFLTSTEADVAVSSMDKQKIVFFDIYKRTVTRELQMNKTVLGMTNAHKQLLVRIDNMGCRFIRPNGQDSLIPIRGDYMPYIAEWNNNIFLTNWKTHEISCYNTLGNLQWIFKDDRMKGPNGLTTDNEGNVFIVGTYSHNILVISKNYQKTNEYEFTDACMRYPIAIDFDRKNSKFIVCNMTGTVKIFQV